MMEYMDLGLKRPVNLLLTIMDKVLMFMGYVYKGLRPVTLIPINQVTKVYFCVYLLILVVLKKLIVMKDLIVVVMMEDVDLGLKRPVTLTFKIN